MDTTTCLQCKREIICECKKLIKHYIGCCIGTILLILFMILAFLLSYWNV